MRRALVILAAVVLGPATAAQAAPPSVPDVIAKVLPSVVNVKTTGFNGEQGEASGVVIDRSGVIVTNFHVVRGARSLTVTFDDTRHHRPVRATVVGTAENSDLAIIRVKLDDLVPITLGRSRPLRLGDTVFTVGFPLDLGGGPTVTHGIVSGLDRTVTARGGPELHGLLQTDAAINPGNSGGALIDAFGNLVGINTLAAVSGTAENVGFAISIDSARSVIQSIERTPAGKQGWIGATLASIASASAAVQIGLEPSARGAAVIAIFSGGPAAKAGIEEGDLITAIDRVPVRSAAALTKALAAIAPGKALTLDVTDQSGPRRVQLVAGRKPATLGP